MKLLQLDQFEKYADAVNANRYRVTAIKLREDGSSQALILDKKNGTTKGFTSEELIRRMPELQRLRMRGENIYYTPLSEGRHHILIDDLSREKLEKLIGDGYKPAAIWESSPGNFQAMITIQKLGTIHDRDVGNRISERLNRAYGDPRLSGAIHPHRAPGFENRKPKHRREDGTYPMVKLLKAERRECPKSAVIAKEINGLYEQAAAKAREKVQPGSESLPNRDVIAGNSDPATIRAFRAQRDAVVVFLLEQAKKKGTIVELDKSRVDSMTALRLRITGHSRDDIERVICECGHETRYGDDTPHKWNDYAKRTTEHVFGPAGDLQVARLGVYAPIWSAVEKSGADPDPDPADLDEDERQRG